MNPQKAAMNAHIARLTDSLTHPPTGGYEAQRHPLLPEQIIVWSPCGCYWVGNTHGSFVTACGTVECDFKFLEVERALLALGEAEHGQPPAASPVGPSLVPAPDTPQNPSEKIHGPSAPAESDVSAGTGTATVAPVQEQIADMISEGGPPDPPMP